MMDVTPDMPAVDDELVDGSSVAIRDRWHPAPAPVWVTCVPSGARPGLVESFARSLAARLELPYVETLTVANGSGVAQGSMQNSAGQLANAVTRLGVVDGAVRPGPVLLVDDIVDAGWTLTVAGWLLRQAGSGDVHPFALAAATARDG